MSSDVILQTSNGFTLQETHISKLGKRKIIASTVPSWGDMSVPRRRILTFFGATWHQVLNILHQVKQLWLNLFYQPPLPWRRIPVLSYRSIFWGCSIWGSHSNIYIYMLSFMKPASADVLVLPRFSSMPKGKKLLSGPCMPRSTSSYLDLQSTKCCSFLTGSIQMLCCPDIFSKCCNIIYIIPQAVCCCSIEVGFGSEIPLRNGRARNALEIWYMDEVHLQAVGIVFL